MIEDKMAFDDRIATLSDKRMAMADGYDLKLRNDGLVVAVPRRRKRIIPEIPGGVIAFTIAIVFVFKAVILSTLGQATYSEKMVLLAQGNIGERAAAFVMQPDPISNELAGVFLKVLP